MGRRCRTDPINPVASAAELHAFKFRRAGGPSLEDFRLDLADKASPTSPWNIRAAEVFAEDFIACGWYSCSNKDFIQSTFRTHMIQLKAQYVLLSEVSDEEPSIEELDEKRVKAREQRRRSVFYRRWGACDVHPDLFRFRPLFETMTMQAVSGDETDHVNGQVRYAETSIPWRSILARVFLRTFDRIHLSTRFTSAGRATAGGWPHRRVPSKRVERSWKLVKGLPVNFYDPVWLKENLDEHEQRQLNMQPAVDLSFTPSIERQSIPRVFFYNLLTYFPIDWWQGSLVLQDPKRSLCHLMTLLYPQFNCFKTPSH